MNISELFKQNQTEETSVLKEFLQFLVLPKFLKEYNME